MMRRRPRPRANSRRAVLETAVGGGRAELILRFPARANVKATPSRWQKSKSYSGRGNLLYTDR
jgi:hypothetical protein